MKDQKTYYWPDYETGQLMEVSKETYDTLWQLKHTPIYSIVDGKTLGRAFICSTSADINSGDDLKNLWDEKK